MALNDREQIFDDILIDNPAAAIAVDETISAKAQILLQFPAVGRPGHIEGTRELVISQTPSILA